MKLLHAPRFISAVAAVAAILILANSSLAAPPAQPSAVRGMVARALENRPIQFLENLGQTDSRVRFYAAGASNAVLLGEEGIVIRMATTAKPEGRPSRLPERRGQARVTAVDPSTLWESVVLTPIGGRLGYALEAGNALPGKVNYLSGDKNPVTGLTPYESIFCRQVWPGVDLKFYGAGRQLEYDLIVAPGADPAAASFRVSGARELRVTAEGDLAVILPSGNQLLQKKPLVYQEIAGSRIPVEARYRLLPGPGDPVFAFDLAAHDSRSAMVIDPVVIFSTFFGADGLDGAEDMAIDAAGNIYLTGPTTSATGMALGFPGAAVQISLAGGQDGFVAKFAPNMAQPIYTTYLGGKAKDFPLALAVDSEGQAIVTGFSRSADFPVKNQFSVKKTSGQDAFVTKFSADGTTLIFSTFLGGNGESEGTDVTVDVNGRIYVSGWTLAGNLPVTANALYKSRQGEEDAFILRIPPAGKPIGYLTYLGGSDYDNATSIRVRGGAVYVAGVTLSGNYPTTTEAFLNANPSVGCGAQGFVTKLTPELSVAYSTYVGGADPMGFTQLCALEIDSNGNAWVSGNTQATDYPVTAGALQASLGNEPYTGTGCVVTDCVVSKLNGTGTKLLASTYLGGNDYDTNYDLDLDASGYPTVVGYTYSPNFPQRDGLYPFNNGTGSGNHDGYVTTLEKNVTALRFSTFLGGWANDLATGVDISPYGEIYIGGAAWSDDFPLVKPFQDVHAGSFDVFVMKLSPGVETTSWIPIGINWWFISALCPYEPFYGLVPVTVYGSPDVNVRDIQTATMAVEGLMTPPKAARRFALVYRDFNEDGYMDMRFRLDARGQVFLEGENEVTFTARTRTGAVIMGETSYKLYSSGGLCEPILR